MTVFKPETEAQLVEAIRWAISERAPLALVGGGSKSALGRPVNLGDTLDLSAFTGGIDYDPPELVLSAGPATKMAEIEALLADQGQELAFEPMDLGPLLGTGEGSGTLGGAILANLSGPRRIRQGAARDHLLGFTCVTGRGEVVKSGGRVMKNVTGYDLSKLIAGSWGTLAALTSITVKVLPRAEKTRTLLLFGLDAEAARVAMSAALGSPHDVSGAAWLPAALAARLGVERAATGAAVTAIRLEGPGPSVEDRLARLRETLGRGLAVEELHSTNSTAFWRGLRDALPFAGQGDTRAVWKISTAPTEGPGLIATLSDLPGMEAFLDWGGGLVWLATDATGDAGAAAIRASVARAGGHATLIRAPAPIRAAVPVFQPLDAGVMALQARIKASFDPEAILNPARMYEGV